MQRYSLTAHYIKTSLNLAKIEQKNADLPLFSLFRKERNALIYKVTDSQYVSIYSFGVVTVFGFDDKKEIAKLIKRCAVSDDETTTIEVKPIVEDYAVVIDPDQPESVEFDFTRLKQLTVEKLLLVFHVVAQSVAIDFLENQVQESMQDIERIHGALATKGSLATNGKSILKMVGKNGNIVHFIINRLSLLDKPDITWEDKEAEALFTGLRKMFELDDRFSAMRYKLEFIHDSSETMMTALHTKRAELMELTVILLIAIEIIMFLPGVMPK